MKVAAIQLCANDDKIKNVLNALRLCEKAAVSGAKFIALPEVFHYRGRFLSSKEALAQAESLIGKSLEPFYQLAKRKKVFILAGSIIEKQRGGSKAFNTSVLINDKGEQKSVYRKINMFDARLDKNNFQEAKVFERGKKKVVVSLNEFHIGMSICYDLRFTNLYTELKKRGANVLCVPSAFTKITGMAHWEVLLRARAIENLSYVIAPNQYGKDGRGVDSFGNSMIIDPWGRVLARAGAVKEEIIYADISLKVISEARKKLPGICK